jgi:prepilin-type N-terminal cleavage/methylation domain-containing protein
VSAPSRSRRSGLRRGFTLVEVMVAAALLAMGTVGVLLTSQQGLQALDTSRRLASASQLMQSELERLRLMSWAQLQSLQDSGSTTVVLEQAVAARYSCRREIRDLKFNMKEISLVATWKGFDGRPHTARLITRYGRAGLNDYFYTAH